MGFVARTIFWLGLVYSAIPLDFGSLFSDRAPSLADANPLAACARGATDACRQRVDDLRKVLDAAAALGLGERVAAASEPAARDKPAPRKPNASSASSGVKPVGFAPPARLATGDARPL